MKPIRDFPGYFVNKDGDVQGIRGNNELIKGFRKLDGRYVALRRNRKNYYFKVSDLVADAFKSA